MWATSRNQHSSFNKIGWQPCGAPKCLDPNFQANHFRSVLVFSFQLSILTQPQHVQQPTTQCGPIHHHRLAGDWAEIQMCMALIFSGRYTIFFSEKMLKTNRND
jgi:hypothetical protein